MNIHNGENKQTNKTLNISHDTLKKEKKRNRNSINNRSNQ